MATRFEDKRLLCINVLNELTAIIASYEKIAIPKSSDCHTNAMDLHLHMMEKLSNKINEFICYFNADEQTYHILAKRWDRKEQQTTYTISLSKGNTITLSAKQLMLDNKLLDRLPPHDICDIAFTYGVETRLNEEMDVKMMQRVKKPSCSEI